MNIQPYAIGFSIVPIISLIFQFILSYVEVRISKTSESDGGLILVLALTFFLFINSLNIIIYFAYLKWKRIGKNKQSDIVKNICVIGTIAPIIINFLTAAITQL